MNERIKELAEQSGFHFYDLHDIDGQDLGETVEADSWSAIDKFAELIVEECAQCIDNEIGRLAEYHNSLNESETEECHDVELCMKKCYDNIELLKTYFGIE